jgi:hypothetical protein
MIIAGTAVGFKRAGGARRQQPTKTRDCFYAEKRFLSPAHAAVSLSKEDSEPGAAALCSGGAIGLMRDYCRRGGRFQACVTFDLDCAGEVRGARKREYFGTASARKTVPVTSAAHQRNP